MKSLRVVSVSQYGESTIDHPIFDGVPEANLIVATLQGVIRAGSTIKSFELVEA